MTTTPAGYTYDEQSATSPVTREQLSQLLTDVMWTDDDAAALRRAGEILRPQVSDLLDVWYDFIGSTPHLVAVFHGTDRKSTRLNSSHVAISYAVFCLKKKTKLKLRIE